VLDKNIIKESGKNKNDTGSTSVQISHFTQRINKINEHLKLMKKDHSSRRGLLILVSKRRKLLKYLKKTNLQEYMSLTEKLNIRK
tara:strand:+ start:256 stop:510 length:255 start_codon:yes stop_codon:yes gene_type:complete